MRAHRWGALAWILSGLLFPAQLLVAAKWPDGYSWTANAISDLGVTRCGTFSEQGDQVRHVCSPWHGLFNASMMATGLAMALGALLLWGRWPSWAGRIGTALMVVTGLGVAGAGLAPWDIAPSLHDLAALVQTLAQWVAMVLLGVACRSAWFRIATIVILVVSAIGFWLFLGALDGARVPVLGFGGSERLAFDTLTVWTVLAGVHTLRRPTRPVG